MLYKVIIVHMKKVHLVTLRCLFVDYGEILRLCDLYSECVIWDTPTTSDNSKTVVVFKLKISMDTHLHEHFSNDDIVVILEDRAEHDGNAILLRLQIPETREDGEMLRRHNHGRDEILSCLGKIY